MQRSTAKPRTLTLKSLTAEAKGILAKYEAKTRELSKNFDEALELAWRFGQKLNEIKATVGHGNWQLWLANNLEGMGDRHARRHMALDSDNPGAQSIADLSEESVRKFRYGFVPEKTRPELPGDQTFQRAAHHLTLVNDWRQFVRRVEIGQAQLDEDEARRDLMPLWEWMCILYGEKNHV
ncbi:hypothetical protein ACXR0O_19065 [Verrucomicrobiota bacterium sgz303538]